MSNILRILLIVVLIALIVVILTLYFRIRNKARELSEREFGTPNIFKGMAEAKDKFLSEERSVSSMTDLLLPLIEKDFPDFNWEQFRLKVQDKVKEYIAKELGADPDAVHRTVISRYDNKEGLCRIETQTSASYDKDGKHKETRFVTPVIYVQDAMKYDPAKMGLSLNCPNCGAPVTNLGHKQCAFCGTAIKELHERVWHVTQPKES